MEERLPPKSQRNPTQLRWQARHHKPILKQKKTNWRNERTTQCLRLRLKEAES